MAGTPIGAGQVTSTAAGSGEDQIHRSTFHDRARIDDVDTGPGPRSGARRDEPRAAYLALYASTAWHRVDAARRHLPEEGR